MDLRKYPLDSEIVHYLARTNSYYPADNSMLLVVENRALYTKMAMAFNVSFPENIRAVDDTIIGRNGNIPIRIYTHDTSQSEVTIVYLHGGGFVVGNLDTHDSICAEIAYHSGYRVIAVDYRLAPEFVHPAPFEDVQDVFLSVDQGQTIIVGDSAGATLAASVCIAQQDSDQCPIGQVLIYPWLGGELLSLDSYTSKADAPALTVDDLVNYRNLRSAGEPEWDDPIYYPLALDDFSKLPPCAAFAAEHDPLRDDAVAYVEKLQQSGVVAECSVEDGLVHGYLRARHSSQKARASFHRICESIKAFGISS